MVKPKVQTGIRKYALTAAGAFFMALGVAGIFLPLLPATPFLLLASFCWLRSSERLHTRLIGSKRLGPYLYNYMVFKAVRKSDRRRSLIFLWLSLCLSALLIGSTAISLLLLAVGIAVSIHLSALKTLPDETQTICADPQENQQI